MITTRMRHLLLSEQWFPHIGGSIHLFDEIYCRRFPPGELMHVLAASAQHDAEIDAGFPHPVTRFDGSRYSWLRPESLASYARMAMSATRVVTRDRIDVVHCARVIPEGLVGMMIKRTLGIPYVVWVHGEEVSMYLRYWGKRALMPEILREARAVICNSTFSRGQAHMAGAPSERLHVVNPCVDAGRFRGPFDTSDLRERFGLAGKKVLLTVGRLTRRKGHDHVLQALARLRRRDVVYLVLSDGELEAELHNLTAELDLTDVVRFVGPVPSAELPRYYAASDAFVMANRTLPNGDVEGFGMVFLEASASGLPVIGGRSGGVVDAVLHGETGLLVDGSSVTDIADAITTVLDDDEARARMGARGREWARQRFGWERAARQVREICAGEEADPSRWVDTPARDSVMAAVADV
jgi:phosphatidylinositol alpha-1,6-mannosyltransferase